MVMFLRYRILAVNVAEQEQKATTDGHGSKRIKHRNLKWSGGFGSLPSS
jgi:hypothetical protein